MVRSFIILAPAMALAACNSSPTIEATNASGSEVAAKVAASGVADNFISPGKWETTVTIHDMVIPNMPPQMIEKMKSAMGQQKTITDCLRPEDVKKPKEDMFSGGDKSCRYDKFTMGGGKMDMTMHCAGERGKREMTLTGTYSPDSYHMVISSQGEAKAMGPTTMKLEMDSKRVGECSAADLKDAGKG